MRESNRVDPGDRYLLVAGSFGHYRREPLRSLKDELGQSLLLVAGDRAVGEAIELVALADVEHLRVATRLLPGDVILQRIPWRRALSATGVVADLNPRNVTSWVLLLVRRLLGRHVVLWGHAWSSTGHASNSDRLRGLMRRLASGLVAYTYSQQAELRATYPHKRVYCAPNALLPAACMHFSPDSVRSDVVYVGRLVAAKKPMLLLHAYASVAREFPWTRLVIAGDGPERQKLERAVDALGLRDRVLVLGHVDRPDLLRDIYDHAITSVSPGYAGLSLIQSFGAGVPCVIAANEPHSPELEAAREGINAVFTSSDDAAALAASITGMVRSAAVWNQRGTSIAAECRGRYSAEAMAAGLSAALRGEAP